MRFDFEERYMLWNIQKSDFQQIQSMSENTTTKKQEKNQNKNK
jgi:hypothetical protein